MQNNSSILTEDGIPQLVSLSPPPLPLNFHSVDVNLCVHNILRYLPGSFESFCKVVGCTDEHKDYPIENVYDLVLTDGIHKSKFTAYPHLLCELIEHGEMLIGSVINVSEIAIRYDDNDPHCSPIRVIIDFNLIKNGYIELNQEPSWAERNLTLIYRPLIGKRIFYLPLFSDYPYSLPYHTEISKVNIEDTEYIQISDLLDEFSDKRKKKSNHNICGRIISKSTIFHFGRNHIQENIPIPLRFEIIINDDTDTMKISIWGKYVLSYYLAVKIGDVIIAENGKVKRGHDGILEYGVEFSKNKNPAQLRLIISNPEIFSFSQLQLTSCDQLYSFPDQSLFDITGFLVYIGPIIRSHIKVNPYRMKSRFMTEEKWIMLSDFTSNRVLSIKIYLNSNTNIINDFQLKDIIGFTRLRLNSFATKNLDNGLRSFFAETTFHSRIVTTDELYRIHNLSPMIKTLFKSNNDFKRINDFIPFFRWNASYKFISPFARKITPVGDIEDISKTLNLSEYKNIIVQGTFQKIQYINDIRDLQLINPVKKQKLSHKKEDEFEKESKVSDINEYEDYFKSLMPRSSCDHYIISENGDIENKQLMPTFSIGILDLNQEFEFKVQVLENICMHGFTSDESLLSICNIKIPQLKSLFSIIPSKLIPSESKDETINKLNSDNMEEVIHTLEEIFMGKQLIFLIALFRERDTYIAMNCKGIFDSEDFKFY